jgi:hypothetical protein
MGVCMASLAAAEFVGRLPARAVLGCTVEVDTGKGHVHAIQAWRSRGVGELDMCGVAGDESMQASGRVSFLWWELHRQHLVKVRRPVCEAFDAHRPVALLLPVFPSCNLSVVDLQVLGSAEAGEYDGSLTMHVAMSPLMPVRSTSMGAAFAVAMVAGASLRRLEKAGG